VVLCQSELIGDNGMAAKWLILAALNNSKAAYYILSQLLDEDDMITLTKRQSRDLQNEYIKEHSYYDASERCDLQCLKDKLRNHIAAMSINYSQRIHEKNISLRRLCGLVAADMNYGSAVAIMIPGDDERYLRDRHWYYIRPTLPISTLIVGFVAKENGYRQIGGFGEKYLYDIQEQYMLLDLGVYPRDLFAPMF
jgi:hypothetical protein